MPLAVLDGEAPAPSPWGSLPLEKYVLSQWDSPAPMSETHSESRTHLIRQFLHLESQGRDASLSSALALFILMLSLTHIQISGRTDLQHHILMRTRRKPPISMQHIHLIPRDDEINHILSRRLLTKKEIWAVCKCAIFAYIHPDRTR